MIISKGLLLIFFHIIPQDKLNTKRTGMEEVYVNSFNAVSVSVHIAYHMIAVTSSNVSSEKSGEERSFCLLVCLIDITSTKASWHFKKKNPDSLVHFHICLEK